MAQYSSNYFERGTVDIRRDMLRWIQDNILARVAEEWDISGDRYDPLVNMIMGACAAELEQVYHEIYNAETRVLHRLQEMLMPEAANVPKPAHALLSSRPDHPQVDLTPQDYFTWAEEQTGKADIHYRFVPLVKHRLLAGEVAYLATESAVYEHTASAIPWRSMGGDASNAFAQKLWIGLVVDEQVVSLDNVPLRFDLEVPGNFGQQIDTQKDILLAGLADAQLFLDDQPLRIRHGLSAPPEQLSGALSQAQQMRSDVLRHYDPSFLVVESSPDLSALPVNQACPAFLADKIDPATWQQIHARLQRDKQRLIPLELHFPYPVRLPDLERNFSCTINEFPVANLHLHKKDDGDTYFNKSSVNIIALEPQAPFLFVNEVYERGDQEAPYRYLPFSSFLKGGTATYSIRSGGIGRWDEYNTWSRLAYILKIFRRELKEDKLLQQLGKELSLEELHEFIRMHRPEFQEEGEESVHPAVYVLLNTGSLAFGGKRIVVEYTCTMAERGNKIPAGTVLEPSVNGLAPNATVLAAPTEGGQAKRSRPEQLDYLRGAITAQNRITTKADIESFCHQFLGDEGAAVKIEKTVYVDPRPGFGPTRAVLVRIQPGNSFEAPREDWEGIGRLMEKELAERSTMFLSFQVVFESTDQNTAAA